MFRVRALNAIICGLMLGATASQALPPSVTVSVQSDSRNGPLDVSNLNRRFTVSQISETFSGRVENIRGAFSIQGGVSLSHPDYSSVTIQDSKGKAQLLSQTVKNTVEPSAQFSTGWNHGSHALLVGWQGNLSRSPFGAQLVRSTFAESFFQSTTNVGITAAYLMQAQPLSYFTDLDFKVKQRPSQIHAYETSLNLEQLLTESWKTRFQIGLSRRIEERPLGYSLQLRQAYAVSNRAFAELGLSYADEFKGPLQNERGFFRTFGVSTALTLEPIYDLLVTFSYGVLWERESDPRLGREIQVASDQYALNVSYPIGDLEIQTQGRYTVTNTGISNVGLSGSVLWKL